MFVQEAKRRGLLVEIDGQLHAREVSRDNVETLTGRLSFTAQVACEGNAHLNPLYRFKNAAWSVKQARGGATRRVKPRTLQVDGNSATQKLFRTALNWWRSALKAGITVPLAPRLIFPDFDQPGCAFMFTDAARENGTGFGGYSLVKLFDDAGGNFSTTFYFHEERWSQPVLQALQADTFSMPAGECYGAVVFADALIQALGDVTHLVVFTDSDATAKALTSAGSGAPQLNTLVDWLCERHPGVQFLGIHQPGVRNKAADNLSRSAEGRASVLADVAAQGSTAVELPLADGADDLLVAAMACPLRA
jgi:hypothetical protein